MSKTRPALSPVAQGRPHRKLRSELPVAERLALRPKLPLLDENQRYSIEEAIAYLRSSRKTLFDDIREGRLATIKEGKRRFVPGSEIARRSRLQTEAA